jgi:hypothetical protein
MRRAVLGVLGGILAACGAGSGGGSGAGDGGVFVDGGGSGGGGGQAGHEGGAPAPTERPLLRFEPAADPPTTVFATVPWPSDLYRKADGNLDLRGFTRPPTRTPLLESYITTIEQEAHGFATSGTMYVSFDGAVDPAALPADGAASLAPESSLYVVDVDPASPHEGQHYPVRWRFNADQTTYLPPNNLSVRLVDGVVLQPKTTYALIITDAVAKPDDRFTATLADAAPDDAAVRAAWEAHAPLRRWLAHASPTPHLAGAAVFTTQDPVSELFKIRDFVHTLPAPVSTDLHDEGIKLGRFELLEGTYQAPRFQRGQIPYSPGQFQADPTSDGRIVFDALGNPVVQDMETIRYSLAIPLGETPANGWPIVMYAHGTGGDWHSYISEKVGSSLARQGVACIAIDQIHHGIRDLGACDGMQDVDSCHALEFFNYLVPTAGRDNVRQSAVDFISLMRMVQGLQIPSDITVDHREIHLRTGDPLFMGHSQGSLNGPLFLAVEKNVRGGMLSGSGADFAITLEQKKLPVDINSIVDHVLRLPANEPLDRWHPVAMLLQTFIEPADGHNYARYWFQEPPEGYRPKSIFMTVGLKDQYAPPDGAHALAASGGVPIILPVEQDVEALDLLGVEPLMPPYHGNVAGGHASAGIAQYANEDHFLIFRIPSAQQRFADFLKSLATSGDAPPTIY